MAGRGSRLRPHTLTIPKPLIPIAGKSIVQRLVEDLVKMAGDEPVDNIAFIIKDDFGNDVEQELKDIAKKLGAEGQICYQDTPEGTAHAIYCAEKYLSGKTIIAFADTLFKADFKIKTEHEGVIYVQKIEDPSAFGVVKLDEEGFITDFVEKPETFVSDLAIIGIYYIKDGPALKSEIEYLLDNDIREKGEYQLTNALENLKKKGKQFSTGAVEEWLDCGNYKATVFTNQRILSFAEGAQFQGESLRNTNSLVIQPCYIGNNVTLNNAIIGPHVSIGDNCVVENSLVINTLIQSDTIIEHQILEGSMIGNKVELKGKSRCLSVGDFTVTD